MTLRNRIAAVSALAVGGLLMIAAPVSAATTHTPYQGRIVVETSGSAPAKSRSTSSGGGAQWFSIAGGLVAGIGLGAGFVVLRKGKGNAIQSGM